MGGNMRLRNKKTGEVVDAVNMTVSTPCEPVLGYEASDQIGEYASLAELNACWEDYKPAEPLIKDEKIRKAVRTWVDSLRDVICDGAINFYVDTAYCTFYTDVWKRNGERDFDIAELDLVFDYDGLEDGVTYTITELCGEEEE